MGKNSRHTPPARAAALSCLNAVLRKGIDLQEALDNVLRGNQLDPRDTALATELAYGVLRHKARLDWLLSRHLRDPGKLPPAMFTALETACYEILFLQRVPAYATVDWAVEHCKKAFGQGRSGLANAVLRKIADPEESRFGLDSELCRSCFTDHTEFLATWYACPRWLVELWQNNYGAEQTLALLEASLAVPPLGLRLRTGYDRSELLPQLGTDVRVVAEQGLAVAVRGAEAASVRELEQAGRLSRQSFAAQQALLALKPDTWPEPVWDGCAGRGGKTCQLLEAGKKNLVASDPHSKRLEGLLAELQRLGLPNIPVHCCGADAPDFDPQARTILLDAPCSGLGVLARRPDAKWRRRPRDLKDLVKLQRRILNHACDLLPEDGLLAYLTCTANPAENQGQIQKLLTARPEMRLEITWETVDVAELGEYFYAALLRKH